MQRLTTLGFVAVVTSGGPILAFAGEGLPDTPPVSQNAPIRLQAGEVAPFDGMLVPIPMAAVHAAKLEGCQRRIEAARNQERELGELKIELIEQLRDNDQEAHLLEVQLLEDELEQVQPALWDHPWVWFGAGIVATIAVIAGSVSILNAIQNPSANLRSVTLQ